MEQFQTLLHILTQPDNPSFGAALQQLATLNPQHLQPAEATALLAALESTIGQLQAHQATTAQELAQLRGTLKAATAYGGTK
jgi:hypothetical protein